jgi:putative flippase GtrA
MPPRPSGHAWRARLIDLVRYAAVSAISTTVGLTSLALLVVVGHWPAGWANLVGTGLGTIPSFELNRRWVWRRNDRRSLSREVVPFCLLCLVELVASSLAVHAVAGWTARQGWPSGVRTATDLLASVATYGALWVVQYVVLDRALFARRPRRDIVSTPVAERDVARAPVAGGHVARTPVAGQLDQARS